MAQKVGGRARQRAGVKAVVGVVCAGKVGAGAGSPQAVHAATMYAQTPNASPTYHSVTLYTACR